MKLIRESVKRLTAYTPGEQPKARDVIKLNTNENPYPPSDRVREALADIDASALRLYPDPVSMALRERIAARHGCTTENVFVGNGSDEVLALCTRAFVENNGTIGYFEPSYSLYPVLADIRDVAKHPVELAEDFSWQMPADYTCSLFFLTNPNAPTGIQYPRNTVAAFCDAVPGVVVIDEAYVDFAREDCAALALSKPNVLVARTFSKSFSLAGLRVGYMLGPAPLIEAMFKLKDSYNLDAISQRLALAALSDTEGMRDNVRRIVATRTRLAARLATLGFQVYPSETNFLWVRPPRNNARDLFDRLRRDNILVRYFPQPRTAACLRITIGTDPQIDALLEWLEIHA